MAAGGIFAEVNQPEIHAREAVEFGLDSIQAVKDIDQEFHLDRRIRVGVNMGGPIVAGVLGTEKPSFARRQFSCAHELGHIVLHEKNIPPYFPYIADS